MRIEEKQRGEKTHSHQFLWRPIRGIIFDNSALGKKGNLDRMDSWLFPEHPFDSLSKTELLCTRAEVVVITGLNTRPTRHALYPQFTLGIIVSLR